MQKFKYANPLTIGQRKALAVLMLAIAFTQPNIPTAKAADLFEMAGQTASVQTAATDDATQTSDAPEIAKEQAAQPTVQEVLLSVCETKGYSEDCARTLLGMLWNESSNRSDVIGDNGKARGYFQIHYRLHNISIACAEDLVCSANWTLDYLEKNSYPRNVSYAVQCHNSCNVGNGYAAKALRNGRIFWDKPLAVKQAAPILLAMK